ncbi:MAG TPA: MarR family transcriptional regulator [Bacillota bacterium]|nr:MarR family transcriptional regulator [Bacillota bacterium]
MDHIVLEKAARLFYRTVICEVIEPALTEMAEEQLTQVQLACMRFVHLHPEPSVGDIADGLAISDAASAKLIDRLVKKGILTREEDPADRRVLKIKLTAPGIKLLETVNRIEHNQFEKIINGMPAESVKALQEGLTAFLTAALGSPEAIDNVCLKCGWEHIEDCPGNLRYTQLTGQQRKKY